MQQRHIDTNDIMMNASLTLELNFLLVELESWDGQLLLLGEGGNNDIDLYSLLRSSYDT